MENLLSNVIDQQEDSVNVLIRNCGIDRSTFYKIKSGKRAPTEEQFCAILQQLELGTEEKLRLIEEFEYRRYWKPEDADKLKVAREFLRFLNHHPTDNTGEANQGNENSRKHAVPEEVLEFIREELQIPFRSTVKIFMPAEMLDHFNWYELIPLLKGADDRISVNILLVPHHQREYDVIRKMKNVEIYFNFIEQTGVEINVYRDRYLSDKTISDPYPYWMIGTNAMIRIREDLEEFVRLEFPSVIAKHVQTHDRRVSLAYRILQKYTNLRDIVQDLTEKCLDTIEQEKHLYVMSAFPCITLAVSDEQIRRYCPDELTDLMCQYHYLISAATHREYITQSGYRKMKENRIIPEWNLDFVYPESEQALIDKNIQERLKEKKLYFLSETSGYVPETYSIAMFEDKEIHAQSLMTPSLVIQIREKELINAMQNWFEYRDKIANIEEELGLTGGDG